MFIKLLLPLDFIHQHKLTLSHYYPKAVSASPIPQSLASPKFSSTTNSIKLLQDLEK